MRGLKMEELHPIDLKKCQTVADIIDAMKSCSFGARMLGEASSTIAGLIKDKKDIIVIYDGKKTRRLYHLLLNMKKKGWVKRVVRPDVYARRRYGNHAALVIGMVSERYEDVLRSRPERAIFINPFGMANPGQIRDGYYSDVVLSDPHYIMPIIFTYLLDRVEGRLTSATELMSELKKYDGIAAEVASGARTFKAMVDDTDCKVFFTLSGAMTIAKMSLIICDMLDMGMVDYVSSTGALMAHGFIESMGLHHYKHNPMHNDKLLARRGINRVTDTLEPETNFDHMDHILNRIFSSVSGKKPISPTFFHRLVGEYLVKNHPHDRGILKSAYEKGVPVFVPAFHDSEIGNDLYVHNMERRLNKKKPIVMNLELDSGILVDAAVGAKRMGIFSIGGGVPRNNVQNVAPLIEIINARIRAGLPVRQFFYGCRICPDPMWFGHLSGCTYSEGMSWRKMFRHGMFSEVHADATLVLPFVVKYVMENMATKMAA